MFYCWSFYEIILCAKQITEWIVQNYALYEFIFVIIIILREKNKTLDRLYYIFNNRCDDIVEYGYYKRMEHRAYCIIILCYQIMITVFQLIYLSDCIYRRIIHTWHKNQGYHQYLLGINKVFIITRECFFSLCLFISLIVLLILSQ